jgi:MFS family permease
VSLVGTWMQVVAQGWLVYRITDSPLMLGLVSVVSLVPVVPVSLLAGVIGDRLPRRNLLIVTQTVAMLQAFSLALLTWLDLIQVWQIIILSFVAGGATALEQPIRLAFVVDTVGKEDLTNAVALNASVYNVGRIVGPAIAGTLVGWLGEAGCFFVNGITYLAVIVALLGIRLSPQKKPERRLRVAGDLVGGLKYIWNTKIIRSLMIIVAVSSFFVLPYLALMPVFARDVLQTGPEGLGFLMTTVGVGAIGGALLVASIQSGNRGKWLIGGSILGPLFLVLFCLSRSLALSLVLVFLVGASSAVRQTLANSLVQTTASEEFHSRVMSIFYLNFVGMSQVGAFCFGAVAELMGAPLAVSIGAAISLVLGLAIVWRMPEVYRLP